MHSFHFERKYNLRIEFDLQWKEIFQLVILWHCNSQLFIIFACIPWLNGNDKNGTVGHFYQVIYMILTVLCKFQSYTIRKQVVIISHCVLCKIDCRIDTDYNY